MRATIADCETPQRLTSQQMTAKIIVHIHHGSVMFQVLRKNCETRAPAGVVHMQRVGYRLG